MAERLRGEPERPLAAGESDEPGAVPRCPRCEAKDRAVAAEVQSRVVALRVEVPKPEEFRDGVRVPLLGRGQPSTHRRRQDNQQRRHRDAKGPVLHFSEALT